MRRWSRRSAITCAIVASRCGSMKRWRASRRLPDGTVVANLEKQKEDLGRRAALRGRPPGQRRRAEPRRRGTRSGRRGAASHVDKEYRTGQPHIFAVGDVIGFPSLALFPWSRDASPPPTRSAFRSFESAPTILTASTPSPRSRSSEKPRSSSPTKDVPYEVGVAYYPRNRARPDPRRHHGTPQNHLSSRNQGAARASTSSAKARPSFCTSARRCSR